MTIYIGSRYENSVVDFVPINRSTNIKPIVFYQFDGLNRITYFTYVWKDGDRLDILGAKFFGQAENWWIIAEYNPEIADVSDIAPGTLLRIPYV